MATKTTGATAATDAVDTIDPELTDVVSPEVEEDAPEIRVKTGTRKVLYTGQATQRTIYRKDWESIGVLNQTTSTWDLNNGLRLPIEDFTDEALDYLRRDGRFKTVDE